MFISLASSLVNWSLLHLSTENHCSCQTVPVIELFSSMVLVTGDYIVFYDFTEQVLLNLGYTLESSEQYFSSLNSNLMFRMCSGPVLSVRI